MLQGALGQSVGSRQRAPLPLGGRYLWVVSLAHDHGGTQYLSEYPPWWSDKLTTNEKNPFALRLSKGRDSTPGIQSY